jgi:hypothetical protein
MNAKTYITNLVNHILGLDALKMRIETNDTLIASLRTQIKELQMEAANFMMEKDVECAIEKAAEDFIDERKLNDAIESALDEQDWDSIVCDALGERNTSRSLEEAIDEYCSHLDYNDLRGFNDSCVQAIQEQIEGEDDDDDDNKPLTNAIKSSLTNLPVA